MAQVNTSKTEEELQRRIEAVYKEAERDIEKKMEDYAKKYQAKEKIYAEKVKTGEISQDDFDAWKAGQVFQGKQWSAKKEQIQKIIKHSNEVAVSIINEQTPSVFGDNLNFLSYQMEKDGKCDFGFTAYDPNAVTNLIKNQPDVLPKWKINEPKDYVWNGRKLDNAVVQGIIQGESFDKISKRVAQSLSTQNSNVMKTFTRTAMTGAQNSGRLQSMYEAQSLGIDIEKEWVATLDSHTRDSHADMDGETAPLDGVFSNGLQYPGDPGGIPAEVYNCRCTLVQNVKKYPSIHSRRDNETGQVVNKLGPDTVENLTYRDWKMVKGVTQTAKMIDERDRVASTLREIANLGHGSVDGGLPFKYKSFDSAFRKIVGDTKEEIRGQNLTLSKNEVFTLRTRFADKTSDALRFTNISPNKHFVEDYNIFIRELEKRGFETIRVKNTLGMHDVSYRGVNTLVRTPSGYIIEMQYHTPQSIDIKENINHKIYEEVRKMDPDDPRVEILNKQMIDNMNSIVSPPNINSIEWVKYNTDQTHNVTPFGKYW